LATSVIQRLYESSRQHWRVIQTCSHRPFQGDNTTPPAVFTVVITNGHPGSTNPEWSTFNPHRELTFIITKHALSPMQGSIVGSFSRGWEDVHAQSMFCAHFLFQFVSFFICLVLFLLLHFFMLFHDLYYEFIELGRDFEFVFSGFSAF
jgi:hypothetical protein